MQQTPLAPWFPLRLLISPNQVFKELAGTRPDPYVMLFKYLVWFALLPPLLAYIGASIFGWRLGAAEPLFLPAGDLLLANMFYFAALLFGLVSTAVVSQWMATTYGARQSIGIHFALVAVIAGPLVVGSVVHLFPHVFINILVLIPALMWSMYLLFKGIPVILKISPERGVLMASALIGYLLVAVVSLLGITVALWSRGIGPSIGV